MYHPIAPPRAKNLEELGVKLANMRYDALVVVFRALRAELSRQERSDRKLKRYELANSGSRLVCHLLSCVNELSVMFHVSAPHMKIQLTKRRSLIGKHACGE